MENYEINEDTYAVIGNLEGMTTIIEKDREYCIEENAYQVMDKSCQYYGSNYLGRLSAAKKMLGCSYKIPIMIEETNSLVFFPTKSSLSEDCCWLNVNYIKRVEALGKYSKIIFNNGKQIILEVTKLSLENQIDKSFRLEAIMNNRKSLKKSNTSLTL